METNYFEALSKVNVSAHVEKKGQFSYLSWPFAVQELGKIDPTATWEVVRHNGLPYIETPLGYFVEVSVTCKGVTKGQIHPVLDNSNRPITKPTPFHINTSIQRALVKAIALHGLGLYIYAGEDLPEGGGDAGNGDKAGAGKKDGTTKPAKNDLDRPKYGMEGLSAEEVQKCIEVARKVKGWIQSGSIGDAVLEKENADLGADETVFFWTFFDSKERRAMKTEHERIRAESANKDPEMAMLENGYTDNYGSQA